MMSTDTWKIVNRASNSARCGCESRFMRAFAAQLKQQDSVKSLSASRSCAPRGELMRWHLTLARFRA